LNDGQSRLPNSLRIIRFGIRKEWSDKGRIMVPVGDFENKGRDDRPDCSP
jgi:hypothetical protein